MFEDRQRTGTGMRLVTAVTHLTYIWKVPHSHPCKGPTALTEDFSAFPHSFQVSARILP
jgi:hypothetical protein